VLKGGFALDLRLGDRSRSTRDVDLAWLEPEAELAEALIAGATQESADFFNFQINRTAVAVEQFGGAQRFRVTASLAGRRFESFVVDIGLAYESKITPDLIRLPGLPGMDDWPAVTMPILPIELHVAEKLHAYSRLRAGRVNTRTKDLVDLVLISRSFPMSIASIVHAVAAVFSSRDSHPVPDYLPAPPEQWKIPYGRLAAELGLPADLQRGYEEASEFINPVLRGARREGNWDPARQLWGD
jgi:hypothetical protein